MESISSLVKKAEENYTSGTTQISEYVSFSLKETLDKIDAYINSKFTSGDEDTLGRIKPFFNIVTAARNIWFRATDLDRKNVKIKATKEADDMSAFLASIHLQEWMKKGFGSFLNEWQRTLATYGSAVAKFVEKNGELSSEVIPWNRLIVDAVDFDANPKIEKLYFTPAQLRMNKAYDQEMVSSLIDSAKSTRKNWSGQQKDNKSEYIEVYEIHGELPLSYLTENEDDETKYQQQMHVISFIGTKNKANNEFTLYKGRESKDPYMLTHLIKEDGRVLGIGAVEHLFEAQWMTNHTAKLIKDQLDLASKIIFQTSDGNFVGKNALSNIENGEILVYSQNNPLTQLNNKPDIVAMQSYGQQWQTQANQITGISESMLGINPPSGTAWGLEEAKLREAHSLFELMIENKGLHIEDMLRKYVIPHLKKKMDTSEEIAAELEAHQIKKLDSRFVPGEAIKRSNQKIKDDILSGKIAEQPDMMAIESQIQGQLNEKGNTRYIRPSEISTKRWKDAFKDLEWKVAVDITGEDVDRQNVMTTLTTVLSTLASNPMILREPNMRLIFNKILSMTDSVSPLELSQTESAPQPMIQPVAQGGGSMQGQLQPTQ